MRHTLSIAIVGILLTAGAAEAQSANLTVGATGAGGVRTVVVGLEAVQVGLSLAQADSLVAAIDALRRDSLAVEAPARHFRGSNGGELAVAWRRVNGMGAGLTLAAMSGTKPQVTQWMPADRVLAFRGQVEAMRKTAATIPLP